MRTFPVRSSLVLIYANLILINQVSAADWPTYLNGFDRAGVTSERLSIPLEESWARVSPGLLRRAWSAPEGRTVEGKELFDRVRFDDAFQVAVVDDKLYYGSSVDHKLYCLDVRTGKELWSFFTGAAIRLAPTVVENRVYVGSDDGHAYCVTADTGKLAWKYRPGPTDESFLGRGEMISRWPIRTGIMVEDGVAYFGAGIFPHENVYVCAVDANDGQVIWRNDNISHLEAGREDLSPQGYILASSSRIFVPSGRTSPKSFDRKTGELLGTGIEKVELSTAVLAGTNAIMLDGRMYHYTPGSRIAGVASEAYITNGTHVARLDTQVFGKISSASKKLKNDQRSLIRQRETETIEDEDFEKQYQALRMRLPLLDDESVRWRTRCDANSSLIVAGQHVFVGGDNQVAAYDVESGERVWQTDIEGDARGLAVASGRLIVSTSNGEIITFASSADRAVAKNADVDHAASAFPNDEWSEFYVTRAKEILERTGVRRGYCLIVGSLDGRLAYELARHSDLKIYGVESDMKKVATSRRALSAAGLYGHRVVIHHADDESIPYSNYFANLVVSDRALRTGQLPVSPQKLARHVKPAGGVIDLGIATSNGSTQRVDSNASLADWISQTGIADQSTVQQEGTAVKLVRGTLPGSGNWSHQYANPGSTASSGDKIVQGGLGVLWYGDPGPELMVNRHQGAVGPLVVDGRLFVQGEDSLMAYDAYNGLFLWEVKNPEAVRTGVFQNRAPSNVAVGGDLLFHMVREKVYAHDVATGEVKATYLLPPPLDRETHEWGYVAYLDGRLFGTATTREIIKLKRRRRGDPGEAATDAIFAIDVRTGKDLWIYQGKSIDFQTIALGPDRAYFIDSSVTAEERQSILRQDKSELKTLTGEAAKRAEERMKKIDVRLAVALDARTGKELWTNPVDVTDCSDIGIGGGKLTLMYHNDTLLLCGANANGHYWKQFIAGEFERRRLVAVSASSGQKMWSKDANYRHRPIIIGDRIIAEPWAFDLKTGEQETRLHLLTGAQVPWSIARPGHHCGMLTGADNMLIFRSGFTGFYDLKADAGTRHFAGHRLGCWINAIPTNGLVVMPEASAGCVCMFSIASTIVMEPREPRRPWSLYSQTGPTTPVKQIMLNLGSPGDRRDQHGRLWLSWPRPSDNPRSKSTDKTGLALELDVQTAFADSGQFFSHDGDATVAETAELNWLGTSGALGLTRLALPLLGTEDSPARYNVRIHFASHPTQKPGAPLCDVALQGEQVLAAFDVASEISASETCVIREFENVKVTDQLVLELAATDDSTDESSFPIVCAIEVQQVGQ